MLHNPLNQELSENHIPVHNWNKIMVLCRSKIGRGFPPGTCINFATTQSNWSLPTQCVDSGFVNRNIVTLCKMFANSHTPWNNRPCTEQPSQSIRNPPFIKEQSWHCITYFTVYSSPAISSTRFNSTSSTLLLECKRCKNSKSCKSLNIMKFHEAISLQSEQREKGVIFRFRSSSIVRGSVWDRTW